MIDESNYLLVLPRHEQNASFSFLHAAPDQDRNSSLPALSAFWPGRGPHHQEEPTGKKSQTISTNTKLFNGSLADDVDGVVSVAFVFPYNVGAPSITADGATGGGRGATGKRTCKR